MKNNRLLIRISKSDKDLIRRVASQRNMKVSKFIYSIVIPYCCKFDYSVSDKKGGA